MDTQEGAGFDERIDYVWVKPGQRLHDAHDRQGLRDHARAKPLNGMWWPSDHGGVYSHAPLRMMRKRLPGSVRPRL